MEIVRNWTLSQPSRDACLAALEQAGVPSAPVQTIEEVVRDPQIHARGMLVEQEHPVLGKVRLPNLPFRFSSCDTTVRTPAPLLGQDNRRIAASLGYSVENIDAMVRDGVLYNEAAVTE
jgi:crotonobetainyl-CoA:carnitine CoA-transferase CaiB-like acyl-CoA transferase